MRRFTKDDGQIALVVLVISAIIMTIGLSVAKKSVVETKITTDEEQLKQAFNAAESGIDYFLGTGKTNFTASDSKSKAEVATSPVGGGTNIVDMGAVTLANEESYSWMVGHNSDGSVNLGASFQGNALTLCIEDTFTGSLKVDYFYYQAPNYQVSRLGYNVVSSLVSGYDPIFGAAISCSGLPNTRSISLPLTLNPGTVMPLLLAVKPIGNGTHIAVLGTGGTFPAQGEEIRSTGTAGDLTVGSNANVNRKVRVVNQYFVPAFMLDAITAVNDVNDN
jgi:Tfp pilus assembly protein PilX